MHLYNIFEQVTCVCVDFINLYKINGTMIAEKLVTCANLALRISILKISEKLQDVVSRKRTKIIGKITL